MAAYPDVKVMVGKPIMGSDSWDTPLQFVVTLTVDPEGAAGSFHFWLEFDSAEYGKPIEIGERLLLDPMPGGSYAIELPPEPAALPRFVFETPGGYLRVVGHYMPPDGSTPINVIVLTFAVTADDTGETFRLKKIGERGANPAEFRPPPPPSEPMEPSEDEGGFVVGRDSSESADEMEGEEDEEEDGDGGSESLGEESDMDGDDDDEGEGGEVEEEEEQEMAGRKRAHDEDEDEERPPPKRARFDCANCLRKALLMCSRCRTTYYCNKDCQAAHYGQHAATCY